LCSRDWSQRMWILRFSPEESFDSQLCTSCGICARVCPAAAVSLEEGRPAFNSGSCIGCAHCGAYCPANCFHLEPLDSTEDTLVNCTFDDILARPFGSLCIYEVYNGAMHIDNSLYSEPIVLLSTAGLLDDGIVEAQFDLVDAPAHCVVGLVLGAESTGDFILLGVNSRGQYTVQKCMNGLWLPVMGLDAFESSRLLPYSLPGVVVSAQLHGNYIDLRVNGQLIQVVRTTMPETGQVGVFVDGYVSTELDRFTVVPSE